jgi:hypothetical protein
MVYRQGTFFSVLLKFINAYALFKS